jgi:putative membrane protein insertion efficiency factor
MQRIVIFALHGYKMLISPLLPSACRFYPTCSEYMMQAVERHGVIVGVWKGTKRLLRCHPFHEGGYDPVR